MTAVAGKQFTVRVMVTDTWDHVTLAVAADTSVAELKRRALADALGGRRVDPDAYLVKFRGAKVLDEAITLGGLGVVANAALIVLPRRRRPVR